MTYEEKFERVRKSLINHCKESIHENWGRMFDTWLNYEADMVFGDRYKNEFKEEFSRYMNYDIEDDLWFAGKNIVFAISAFMSFKSGASLSELLSFTEHFINTQLDDFDNWCDHISMVMYRDSSEYEREYCERKEDNPS